MIDPEGLLSPATGFTPKDLEEAVNKVKEAIEKGKDVKEAIEAFEGALKVKKALMGDDKARNELIEEGIEKILDAIIEKLGVPSEVKKVLKYALQTGNSIGSWFGDNLAKLDCQEGCKACELDRDDARTPNPVPDNKAPRAGDGKWDSSVRGGTKTPCMIKDGVLYYLCKFQEPDCGTLARLIRKTWHTFWVKC